VSLVVLATAKGLAARSSSPFLQRKLGALVPGFCFGRPGLLGLIPLIRFWWRSPVANGPWRSFTRSGLPCRVTDLVQDLAGILKPAARIVEVGPQQAAECRSKKPMDHCGVGSCRVAAVQAGGGLAVGRTSWAAPKFRQPSLPAIRPADRHDSECWRLPPAAPSVWADCLAVLSGTVGNGTANSGRSWQGVAGIAGHQARFPLPSPLQSPGGVLSVGASHPQCYKPCATTAT